MKFLMTNDSIISLENVRRVDKTEATSKREPHTICITYNDKQAEWLHFHYDNKDLFENTFQRIWLALTEED